MLVWKGFNELHVLISAMNKDLYFVHGMAIALSLVHRGPAPRFFSELLYAQIADVDRNYMDALPFISSSTVQEKITKVNESHIFIIPVLVEIRPNV